MNRLVTVGLKHVLFWKLEESGERRRLKMKKGLFGRKANGSQAVLCIGFANGKTVTGVSWNCCRGLVGSLS